MALTYYNFPATIQTEGLGRSAYLSPEEAPREVHQASYQYKPLKKSAFFIAFLDELIKRNNRVLLPQANRFPTFPEPYSASADLLLNSVFNRLRSRSCYLGST